MKKFIIAAAIALVAMPIEAQAINYMKVDNYEVSYDANWGGLTQSYDDEDGHHDVLFATTVLGQYSGLCKIR